jgi:hypothetical protein
MMAVHNKTKCFIKIYVHNFYLNSVALISLNPFSFNILMDFVFIALKPVK